MTDSLTLRPVDRIDGSLWLPGSKSVSNRVLILAALARGQCEISNLLAADDVRHMLSALKILGVNYHLSEGGTRCLLTGNGRALSVSQPVELYLGNAGTAMRPLSAALCLGHGEFSLTGEPRMEERPIRDLVDALRQAGADIAYLKKEGYPPLRIRASGLRGGSISVRGDVSSQFLSALLMAAPLFSGDNVIRIENELVSQPYIALTLDWIARFGGVIANDSYKTFTIAGNQTYRNPEKVLVEGDASAASYFLAAAAIKGGSLRANGISLRSTQGDVLFTKVLEQMGAKVTYGDDFIEVHRRGRLHGVDLDCNHITDAAMTLAVTALFAEGPTRIRNVGNWRVKETDRLAAMATELRKVGATVTEGADFLEIHPPTILRHAEIDTYQDHRMAMCFSLLALGDASVTIRNPGCVSKTFPDYFEKFESVCRFS